MTMGDLSPEEKDSYMRQAVFGGVQALLRHEIIDELVLNKQEELDQLKYLEYLGGIGYVCDLAYDILGPELYAIQMLEAEGLK